LGDRALLGLLVQQVHLVVVEIRFNYGVLEGTVLQVIARPAGQGQVMVVAAAVAVLVHPAVARQVEVLARWDM
jgi:hypothetical protein